MTIPEDTPEDVWQIARELLGEPDTVTRSKNIEGAARAILTYGQRRADEGAARISELEAEVERLRKQLAAHLPMAGDGDAQSDDGWITWVSGACPVDDDTMVTVKLRNAMEMRRTAHTLTWHHLEAGGDVMAYRVTP